MKRILSERNIVVLLFVMVLVTFSLAQEDSKKKMTQIYSGVATAPGTRFLGATETPAFPINDNKVNILSPQ
jgi:hypothetical protein